MKVHNRTIHATEMKKGKRLRNLKNGEMMLNCAFLHSAKIKFPGKRV